MYIVSAGLTLLALPLMAVVICVIAGVPAVGTNADGAAIGWLQTVVEAGTVRMGAAIMAVIFGAWLGELMNKTGVTETIIKKDCGGLISCHTYVLSVLFYCNAKTVTVGVGGEDDLRTLLVSQLDGQAEGVSLFGVGHLDGGERGIGQLLLHHDGDVGDADFLQDAAHRHIAGAVQGRVDDLQAGSFLFTAGGQLADHGQVVVDQFLNCNVGLGNIFNIFIFEFGHKRLIPWVSVIM